jgi:hypothetical protein
MYSPEYVTTVLETIANDARNIQHVDPHRLGIPLYSVISLLAVKLDSMAVTHVVSEQCSCYFDIAKEAIRNNRQALQYADAYHPDYRAIFTFALQTHGGATLLQVPLHHDDYTAMAKEAVTLDVNALQHVPKDHCDRDEIETVA